MIILQYYLYRGNAASGVYEFEGLSLRLALDIEAAHEVDERAVVAVAAGVGHAAPLHAGVVLLVLRAVEVLVLAPVQVALAADAAALEVLLDQVDDVLEVEVVSVALYQLVRQLVLEELSQLVGVDEPQGDDGHLRQEEYQQTQRVESEDKGHTYLESLLTKLNIYNYLNKHMFSLKAPIHPAKLTMKTMNPMMRSRKPMLKMTSKIVSSLNASPLDHLSMMA